MVGASMLCSLPLSSLAIRPVAAIAALTAAATTSPPAAAQDPATATDPEVRLQRYARHLEKVENSPHGALRWQFLGPTNISGRVTDVAVPAPRGESYAMYVAGASGGVWKTDNEGTTWTPVFEHAPSTSIGDVTVAPSDHDVVWIGTGEANIFRSSMAGCGVYKSIDAGASWQHMGLAATHTVARIVVHPADPDVVYVAASGHEWTDNRERGVFKSTDGGQTWEHSLYIDDRTGAIDLVLDPSDPETLYAATWERVRKRWNDPRNEDGYDGSGIYKSTDGGLVWTPCNTGLPGARWRGRIGIDLCAAQPRTLYAFVDSYELVDEEPEGTDSYGRPMRRRIEGAQIYRSDDGAESWQRVSPADEAMRRHSGTYGWVFGQIRVDPTDPDVVYTMGLGLHVSRDGGRTYRRLRGMHGDHHALWIDPRNPRYLVNGNDGGAVVSYDGGETWKSFTEGLPMVQFFNVGVDMAEPFRVYGSIQDHGSFRAPVELSKGRDAIPAQRFERAPGGEGSSHAIDPTDPDTVYAAGFYGRIHRTDMRSGDRRNLVPRAAEGEAPLRGQWVAPFVLSPHNPRILYHGMNALFRSWDRGEVWEQISGDLSYGDAETRGDIPYHTISTIAESPFAFGRLYVGTDDGRAWTTPDGGGEWQEITAGLASDRWISRVEASRHAEGRLFLAQNGKRHDDFLPYLWVSEDHGAHWRSLADDIPLGPINVVREDPVRADVLYVGTDLGVYSSCDRGLTWQALAAGMPSTFVHDLVVHERDHLLVAATHGRGMFVLDVRPLHEGGEDEAPK